MQFVSNGPDIPDALLQAQEEGRVVFFCGAGISYPAGLPGFKGLVDEIYRLVGTTRTSIEEEAYARNQFDAALDLLERRLPGRRIAVRTALASALKPRLRRKGATDTHNALLQLARNREGSLRLVTTNFDRVFEYVAKRTKLTINPYSAPMLPIPKNSRWNGLVYLHGLLPAKVDDAALHRLVLTSGDFGLAYLTERWAARFVSELFRNYVVCFVGYSINDPVLRYMMDALAADRMLGEVTPQAFALGDCEPGQERIKAIEWEAKGVKPILYDIPLSSNDHSALHGTLKVWAETYRDGILGKERIVVSNALAHPSASSGQDDFVGRVLWALSHESGLPAKRFADFNPVPPLAWLEVFSQNCYQQSDLGRFGVLPFFQINEKLRFSLLHRPTPYTHAPWMSLASEGGTSSKWDNVMFHLARWLVRHLNDPALLVWLVQQGGQLHNQLPWLVEDKLNLFDRLDREGKAAELDEIRLNAPNAIPGPLMQKLWRLLLTGRVKSQGNSLDFHRWVGRLKRDGLTTMLRLELRELLSPKIVLTMPFRWPGDDENGDSPDELRKLVDWELALAADHLDFSLRDLTENCSFETLMVLLDDFQKLLRDALDLLCELGEANSRSDRSHWDLPSISPHWQNRGFYDWVMLIELLRDAWHAIRESNPVRGTEIAVSWFNINYPAFKRLALFAASHDGCIAPDQWVDWLLSNDTRWLWSVDTQRETMRLLVLQGASLSPEAGGRLEAAILAGPPRAMYRDEIESEDWQSMVDRSVWLHLAKLKEGGWTLSEATNQRFTDLSVIHSEWELASNERDEFSHWMSGTGDPGYEESRDIDIAPRKRQELVMWLKQPPLESFPFCEDTWRETCRTRFFHSLFALCDLAKDRIWPVERWREALQVWSEDGKVVRSWRFAAPLVQTAPDEFLVEAASSITWWLEAASKSIDIHEILLLDVCNRILTLPHHVGVETDPPVTRAINHPVGHVTQALLNLWFKREPNVNDTLPTDIEPIFTKLCDTNVEQFRHGRVLLASRLIALFRVDRHWTETYLLPLFEWETDAAEAKAVWEGFLWSPRLYQQLLIALKAQFLETANYYADLGTHRRQFAAFLTYAALDQVDGYTAQDFQAALGMLPQDGLREAAQALSQAIEGAGEQGEDYWRNRIKPFWQHVWPKSRDLTSNGIAESLARMSFATRGEFPAALLAIQDWLQPLEHPDFIVDGLCESGLPNRFPNDSLCFLDLVIDNQPWVPRKLGQCLTAIVDAEPELGQDPRFQRLLQYSRLREN